MTDDLFSSMSFAHSVILGIVEGLTEFIPVSSTGHLIIAGNLLDFTGEKASAFEIFIQLGAILAVLVLYRGKFIQLFNFKNRAGFSGMPGLKLLFLTTLPALIFGFLLHGMIKRHLFGVWTVLIGLFAGGAAIILIEHYLPAVRKNDLDCLDWKDALSIGCFQCLSLWPGMSRSASTILGGMLLGIERKTAVEYSFFAAVPVMFAATLYDLYKSVSFLNYSDLGLFAAGFIVSFVSAMIAVKFFIKLLSRWTLAPFGWYRITVSPILYFFMQ